MPSRAHQPSSAASAAAFSSAGITMSVPKIWCSTFRVKTPEPPSFVTSHWAKTSASRNAGGAGLSSTSNVPQPAFCASQHNSTPCNPPPTIVTRIRPPPSRNFLSPGSHPIPVPGWASDLGSSRLTHTSFPQHQPLSLRRSRSSGVPPPQKSPFTALLPASAARPHARYSPGKAGSSPSTPSCLTTAATLLR